MWNRLSFLIKRLQERLWVRPLAFSILSVAAAIVARSSDRLGIASSVPEIASDSIETLLSITAGSMLVIATLAVTSMVSAYASASATATPRSFSLLVADDLSQNALSIFLGAFIFSFVGIVALENGFYGKTGLFVLFCLTVLVVAIVLLTFVRWVDWIARLGRIGTTVEKVEAAGAESFRRRICSARLGGAAAGDTSDSDEPVYGDAIGYVRHVNVEALQECARSHDVCIVVSAVPGVFVSPDRELAQIRGAGSDAPEIDRKQIASAFDIGTARVYDDDPRFALLALSETASRALSPAVNDPGTAITILGSFVRLFSIYANPQENAGQEATQYDRVLIPGISEDEMLEDAFGAIARDGAGIVEVQIRLQKTLQSIAALPNEALAQAARKHARAALRRAEDAIAFAPDLEQVEAAAAWSA